MELTIPEAVLLLAIDDERGSPLIDDAALGIALAAAAAVQLLLDGRMRVAGAEDPEAKPGRLVASTGATDARLEPLVERIEGRKPAPALRVIAGWGGRGSPGGRVREQLLSSFEEAGVLIRERDRFLGIPWRTRWERGVRRVVEDAAQERARAALRGTRDPVIHAALAILHGAGALPEVFPAVPEAELKRRGEAIAAGDWVGDEVRSAIAAIQEAMTATMVSSVIAPGDQSVR